MYYSQLVGNPYDRAVIKGLPNFEGMALIDSDPYEEGGVNWYTNQNNFFRAIRNLVIDTTDQPLESGTGLHWQVAQATSLLNIKFIMSQADGNKHQGIFMDNGSGGHMSDLEFVGGLFGAWMGNQQFISRNMKFTNCQTAIYVNWNWQWTFKSLDINNCGIALDISGKEDNGALKVGSVIMLDSVISNTKIGLKTSRVGKFDPPNAQSAVLDNVKLINVGQAVASDSGETILAGGSLTIDLWGQGQTYNGAGDIETVQGPMKRNFPKPAALLSTNGKILERARPQYINYKAEDFISVRDHGAKGDGKTDDTEALRAIFLKFGGNSRKIIYFDHGVYVVSDTVQIPVGSKLLGEVWSVIMADGKVFQDPTNPKAVFRVGNPGDQGIVEMSEFIFQTRGPQPGAILLQWNSRDASGIKGSNALFDVHFRVGGSAGTELETHQCVKKPDHDNSTPDPKCIGSFLHLHITKRASLYIENCWAWTSDHALDFPFTQITIYNGRGILSESKDGPVWFYAAAAEHNVLYQYQIMNSQNVFMAMIQSETPYFQPNPTADKPFPSLAKWNDPDYSKCTTDDCKKSWALRILNSDKVLIYGAGLYSFFQNYNQGKCFQSCLLTRADRME